MNVVGMVVFVVVVFVVNSFFCLQKTFDLCWGKINEKRCENIRVSPWETCQESCMMRISSRWTSRIALTEVMTSGQKTGSPNSVCCRRWTAALGQTSTSPAKAKFMSSGQSGTSNRITGVTR